MDTYSYVKFVSVFLPNLIVLLCASGLLAAVVSAVPQRRRAGRQNVPDLSYLAPAAAASDVKTSYLAPAAPAAPVAAPRQNRANLLSF